MTSARYDDSLPALICRPMQLWLAMIGFGYLAVQYLFPLQWNPLYKANGQVFDNLKWYHISGAMILILAYLLNASPLRPQPLDTFRVFLIIFLSVLLLSLVVFLTGGFTDSPFSGAVALYIGFFVILTKRPEFRLANWLLIAITILLLALPYLHLSRQGYAELHILHWHDKPPVLWSRWTISLAFLLIAAVVGERISTRIGSIKEISER